VCALDGVMHIACCTSFSFLAQEEEHLV